MQNAERHPAPVPSHHPSCSASSRSRRQARSSSSSATAMPGVPASTTLQYTGIAVFVAVVLYAVLYYSRSFNSVFLTRRHDAAGDDDDDAAVTTARPGPVQPLGLGPDDVAVLPTFTYRAASASPDVRGGTAARESTAADCCAVCLEDLREGALVRMLASCKHYFHAGCVDVWLLSHATCPVCRGSPGQEMVRLGVASLSPPLPQLRRCGASSSPAGGGGTSSSRSKDVVSSRSPSPAAMSPTRFGVSTGNAESATSPAQPRTPEG